MRESHQRGAFRERGAALVIVLIFGVGVLMATTTLLALADRGAKTSAELDRHRRLQTVVKAGMAAALNEMNRAAREPGWDPGRDGIGAITRAGSTGANDGVVLTTTDGEGRTIELGTYRTTVRREGARKILTVVAAWPSFDAPDDRRLLLASEVELRETALLGTPDVDGLPTKGAGNPLNIQGRLLPLNFGMKLGEVGLGGGQGSEVNVSGIDEDAEGEPANVPAANVEATILDTFIAVFVPNADQFVGDDPLNPGSLATRENTITVGESPVLNDETLENARAAFAKQVEDVVKLLEDNGLNLGGPSGSVMVGDESYELLNVATIQGTVGTEPLTIGTGGTLVIPNNAVIKGNVKGSGTLIVRDGLEIEGSLDWDGEIIIAGFDESDAAQITNSSSLLFDNGGKLSVKDDGNVVLLGKDTTLKASNGSRTEIDGGLLLLSEDGSNAKVTVQKGAYAGVEGVWVIYGEVNTFTNAGAVAATSLTMAFSDDDALRNKLTMDWLKGSKMDLIYDDDEVQQALRTLWPRLGALGDEEAGTASRMKVDYDSYWEGSPRGLLAAQQVLIAGEEDAPFGVDHGQGNWGR